MNSRQGTIKKCLKSINQSNRDREKTETELERERGRAERGRERQKEWEKDRERKRERASKQKSYKKDPDFHEMFNKHSSMYYNKFKTCSLKTKGDLL